MTGKRKELEAISRMLDQLLNGEPLDNQADYKDKLPSKICHQLARLSEKINGNEERLRKERDEIKELIAEIAHQMRNMELCGVSPKDAKPRAAALLEGVGITKEQMGRFPSKLSGGERQRVAIARSLASNAKIILGDEPTGNLDGANTQNIIDILCSLAHEKGYCVIIVTHDMEVAEAADEALRMRDGELRAG